MKNLLGSIVLALGLAACALDGDTTEDTALSSVAAEVSVAETDRAALDESTSQSLSCLVFQCRQCSPFQTQNILVDICTGEIVQARPCGEECF
jgi:hypothetical protein